jgi:enterochelin esterase-like enzyme
MSQPSVIENQLIFTIEDPRHLAVRVALDADDAVAGRRLFRRTAKGWTLAIPRPELTRLEYRLVVTDRKGHTTVVCDDENPERVRTAFGERSVALMPGYERPAWMQQREVEAGEFVELTHSDEVVGDIRMRRWSPSELAADAAAPMLVVHDGPEYVELADLVHYAGAMIGAGTLPSFRILLFQPVERDEWYAANADYVAAELEAIDMVGRQTPVSDRPVIMGASLGGLCALLVALAAQPRFDGVFAQSGSFFQPELDPQEASYPFFEQVTKAVASIASSPPTEHPLVVGLTCGALEENADNNAAMAELLSDLGHHVTYAEVADLHNYTAWRDSLDPALTDVLRSVWTAPR